MAEKKLRESQVDLSRIDGELEAVNIRIDGLGKVFNYKGRVDTKEQLPSSGNKEGDLYLVGTTSSADKAEYFWTGSAWEYLGNTSNQNYATETAPGISQIATTAEVNAGTNNTKYVTPYKMKAFVDNKISTKADLVDGKVPDSQLPEQVTNAVKKTGDTMTGRLSMGANDILFQNPDGGSLLQIATDGNNWDLRGDATWLRFSPDQFGLTLRDMLGGQDFFKLLDTKTVKDYIVDRYSDEEGNWYEVYSSGWIRQGGLITGTGEKTITFLKPFASNLYTAFKNYANNSDTSGFVSSTGMYDFTATTMKTKKQSAGREHSCWIAEGQGA